MNKNDIIKKGTKFECQGSGNCCVSRNSYGYVYLSKKDLIRLSKHMKLTINKFINLYCSFTKKDKFLHLKEIKDDKNCIFLKNKKCEVYNSRPEQCRTWPFWPENMNAKTWEKDISIFCPGINKGRFYSSENIENIVKKDIKNSKNIIEKK